MPREDRSKLADDILWRGNVHTGYDRRRWLETPSEMGMWSRRPDWIHSRPRGADDVELEIELFVDSGSRLFHPVPLLSARSSDIGELFFDDHEETLARRGSSTSRLPALPTPFIYSIVTRQRYVAQMVAPKPSKRYLAHTRELSRGLSRLSNLARQLTEGVSAKDTDEKIARIMNHFSGSDNFAYSLDSHPLDPDIDPVEDFLFNRRSGHCQLLRLGGRASA